MKIDITKISTEKLEHELQRRKTVDIENSRKSEAKEIDKVISNIKKKLEKKGIEATFINLREKHNIVRRNIDGKHNYEVDGIEYYPSSRYYYGSLSEALYQEIINKKIYYSDTDYKIYIGIKEAYYAEDGTNSRKLVKYDLMFIKKEPV